MKRLLIFALIAALPAAALSLKDWNAKSDREQLEYLAASFARLTVNIGRTDKALAERVRSYYGDKPAGVRYPEGFLDLMQRIGRIEQQAKAGKADLAKIEIDEVILQNTAAKFTLPDAVTGRPQLQRVPPPAKPAPPKPAPKTDTSSGGFGHLIGTGGFITPPEMTPALCVPPDLVDRLSFDNPPAGSDMDAFKNAVMRYVMNNAVGRQQYLVKRTAFEDFVRARRAAQPSALVEAIPDGKECANTMYLYRLRRPTPPAR
ncbi:MAG: hypothetical protein ACRD8O_17040 [Bryobacteraceae bacterium]